MDNYKLLASFKKYSSLFSFLILTNKSNKRQTPSSMKRKGRQNI